MASSSGDQYTVRIGGAASGPVVAGHHNRVETHPDPAAAPAAGAAPDVAAPDDVPAPDAQPAGPTQTNTAHGHSSLFTVMNGELHVHHENSPPPPPEQ
ncbi:MULTISPECIES: hypothetical protein [unclassified Streptomyces]|uniref:hypothetical protein n=1 Tax=unclassified Streptomyces TaxID=2593676 RepID=UPI002DDB4E99|nr:hypothetical protein [Streptomyces sp. NBC_01766]WSC22235.1 hypothetical protein OIE60_22520 [Streptomyces sp. NBC_01766]WSV56082.1 hypothetical protein OG282_21615 [Streptomyces sp. NBC_01014]